MKLRTSSAWATSVSLHCLMLALAVFTWKVKPIINPSPEIPVSIISDVASSVGNDANEGDTTQEIAKATSPEPEPETKKEEEKKPAEPPAGRKKCEGCGLAGTIHKADCPFGPIQKEKVTS